MKLGILISGRGSNMAALLKASTKGQLPDAEFVVVFSNKPDAPGLDVARENGIPVESVPSRDFKGQREVYDQKVCDVLNQYGCEGLILAGYMRLITPVMLDAFPGRILNIHPSLLPSFPGLHAQKQALDWGVKVSGCTVHLIDEGMDSGPILVQRQVPVLNDDTEDTLAARILEQEHAAFVEGVRIFSSSCFTITGRRSYIT